MGERVPGRRGRLAPVRIAVISLLMCGIFFPLLVTGLAQLSMPYQANGEIASAGGRAVGSYLVAQQFTQPIFFHTRNDSASGADPDITLADAYSQVQRIHKATGIPVAQLDELVNKNVVADSWISGQAYVNVLSLNIQLIKSYPDVYSEYP